MYEIEGSDEIVQLPPLQDVLSPLICDQLLALSSSVTNPIYTRLDHISCPLQVPL